MARADLARYQSFPPRALGRRLEQLARTPGLTRSAIFVDAVRSWFERVGQSLATGGLILAPEDGR